MKDLKNIAIHLTFIISMLVQPSIYAMDNNTVLVFATTPAASAVAGPIYNSDDTKLLADRPGHRAELLMQAAARCHAKVEFMIVPWKRALHLVKYGGANAIYSASFTKERATYGAFPMKNGELDPNRALRSYSYVLYTRKSGNLKWDGKKIIGSGKEIAVERSSAAVELVKSFGLKPIEMHKETDMIQMLIAGRVSGLVAILGNIKPEIDSGQKLEDHIEMQLPPLELKYGYVMFSKQFYSQQTQLVECFWNAVGDIRTSQAHKDLIKSYHE